MVVFTPSVVEVVSCAGGWLFDRAMAGWHVTVLVADPVDPRPLRILGVEVLDLEAALTEPGERGPLPRALAVAGELYESDARVRRGVLATLDQHAAEVTFWGQRYPGELDRRVGAVQHQLSLAARAFKAHALAAVGAPLDSVSGIETFRNSEPRQRPRGLDLISAG